MDKKLESFVKEVVGESHLRVEADLGDGFVRLRSSEAERRQAIQDIQSTEDIVIELLRNARDAGATAIYLAFGREGTTRRIVAIDNGCGIPPSMHTRIFEPRVTSKLDSVHKDKWGIHGRGMALYSISVNAASAYVIDSALHKGSVFYVEIDLNTLGEKTDQSTFPHFEMVENDVAMRGPKNIVRVAAEFALEHRKDCQVFCGSSTEIAATIYEAGRAALPVSERIFCSDPETLPSYQRLSTTSQPGDFAQKAKALGLDISERSARRILDGDIKPLPSMIVRIEEVLRQTVAQNRQIAPHRAGKSRSLRERPIKFSSDDTDELSKTLQSALGDLQKRYFFNTGKPEITVSNQAVRITIPIERIQ